MDTRRNDDLLNVRNELRRIGQVKRQRRRAETKTGSVASNPRGERVVQQTSWKPGDTARRCLGGGSRRRSVDRGKQWRGMTCASVPRCFGGEGGRIKNVKIPRRRGSRQQQRQRPTSGSTRHRQAIDQRQVVDTAVARWITKRDRETTSRRTLAVSIGATRDACTTRPSADERKTLHAILTVPGSVVEETHGDVPVLARLYLLDDR